MGAVSQADSIFLIGVIEIVGRRFAIWPVPTELKGRGGKGVSTTRNSTSSNPRNNDALSSWDKNDWAIWQQVGDCLIAATEYFQARKAA